jgi:putative holliday junction resolvase
LDKAPRILALDYGRSRIGVAVSDELGLTAQPVATISCKPKDAALSEIGRLVVSFNVRRVIIGLPLTLKGDKATSAVEVERFAQQLERYVSVPIGFWDERMTSALANRLLHSAQASTRRDKGRVDRAAAAVLLQSYLDHPENGLRRVEGVS